jgi:hypothetical protein
MVQISTGHNAVDVPFVIQVRSALFKTKKVWANLPQGSFVPAPQMEYLDLRLRI